MFLGTFEHAIDEKNRITIPAKYRDQLATGLVVTVGFDGCLWLWPKAAWDELSARISQQPITKPAVRQLRRRLFSDASDDTPDKQGRITLPDRLLSAAHIDKQALIVGLDTYCEIWNPDTWRQRQAEDTDDRADLFESLGI